MAQNPLSKCSDRQVHTILHGMLSGMSTSEISVLTNLSRQAVNRNINSIRNYLYSDTGYVLSSLISTITDKKYPLSKNHIELFSKTISDLENNTSYVLEPIYNCVVNCPVFDEKSNDIFDYLGLNISGELIVSNHFRIPNSFFTIHACIKSKRFCKSCKRNVIFDPSAHFVHFPNDLIDLLSYFAKRKIRDKKNLRFIIFESIIVSLWAERFRQIFTSCESLDDIDVGIKELGSRFRGFVSLMYMDLCLKTKSYPI